MMKASGVDYSSKVKLKALQIEGYTAAEISSMIAVEEKCVQSWMDHFEPKSATKSKVKKKGTEEE